MESIYLKVLKTLAQHQVCFVVAGGVAAVLHGVERVTMDLDIAVEMSKANLANFIEAIGALSLKPRVPVAIDFICDPENRRILIEEKNALVFTFDHPTNVLFHLDVFVSDNLSYPRLIEECVQVDLDGHSIAIVSVKKLIELKEAVEVERPKDIHDIMVLKQLLNVSE